MQDRFQSVLKEHAARYPAMTPQDYGKLAYQNVFGPEHLVQDTWQVGQRLREEWMTLPPSASGGPWAEPIGNGLCRLHLAGPWDPEAAALTAELFCRTAREHSGTPKELAERLDVLRDQPVPGMEEWLASYEAQGCPAVHHSEAFRAAYQPHYRVLAADYAHYFPALLAIRRLLAEKGRAVVAVDGRCGVMDGEIASSVGAEQTPMENDQSNFGTGYGYQRMSEDTVELLMDDRWIVFESVEKADGSSSLQ